MNIGILLNRLTAADVWRNSRHDGSTPMTETRTIALPPRIRPGRSLSRLIIAFAFLAIANAGIAVDHATKEKEIKNIYKKLINAENKHDLPAVRALVWNSPATLFVAKAPVGWHAYWGIDDVIQHLHDMYQQPFRI